MFLNKTNRLFLILNLIFVTCLLMAEVTGSKLFNVLNFTMTLGVIPFPVTFILTDILNEYYGKKAVRTTTYLGMMMVVLAYFIIIIGLSIPASSDSPVSDFSFKNVFANSTLVIIGSVTAYLIGQLIDIQIFHFLRKMTKGKYIWLRATGSTVISQLIDSFVVIFIAFGSYLTFEKLMNISLTNFLYKFLIAILITPLIYFAHNLIQKYLGEEEISELKKNQGN